MATVKAATRGGKLGFLSKVADQRLAETGPQAGRNPYGRQASIEHPCCIYTRDCRDSADVARGARHIASARLQRLAHL